MRLQVKGFINFGFWFLKILAMAGIFLLFEPGEDSFLTFLLPLMKIVEMFLYLRLEKQK